MTSSIRKVAVIASPGDPHVGMVVRHLSEEPAILLDAPDTPISFRMHDMMRFPEILQEGNHFGVEAGVWLRVMPTSPLVGALPFLLPASMCISPLASVVAASHPIMQLAYARRSGMHVQPILLTARAAEARAHIERYGRCTIRPLGNDWLTGRLTVSIRDTDDLDAIEGAPTIMQPVFAFSHNVRVVAVGEKVMGASVSDYTPHALRTQDTHDWREGLESATFTATSKHLPDRLVEQVRAYMTVSNLKLAVFDFAVGRDGNYTFMGCDPNGDWWFLEQHASLQVGQEVARQLQAGI